MYNNYKKLDGHSRFDENPMRYNSWYSGGDRPIASARIKQAKDLLEFIHKYGTKFKPFEQLFIDKMDKALGNDVRITENDFKTLENIYSKRTVI